MACGRIALRDAAHDEGFNDLPRTALVSARWDPNAPARAALLHTDGTLRVWDGPSDAERVYDIVVGALTLPRMDANGAAISAQTVRRLRGPWQDVRWVPGKPGDIVLRQKHSNKVFVSHLPDFDALVQGYAGGEDIISIDHATRVTCVAIHPKGRAVLTGEVSGALRLWSLHSPDMADGADFWAQPEAHGGAVLAVDLAVSHRGDGLGLVAVTAGADKVLRVWDGKMGAPLAWVPMTDIPSSIRFVTERESARQLVVCGTRDGSICCWRSVRSTVEGEERAAAAAQWRLVQIIDHTREAIVATSCADVPARGDAPAERLLATASNDGVVRVYSAPAAQAAGAAGSGEDAPTSSWRRVRDFEFESPVVACTFHHESDVGTVLCACADGSTRIWSIVEHDATSSAVVEGSASGSAGAGTAAAAPAAASASASAAAPTQLLPSQSQRTETGGAPLSDFAALVATDEDGGRAMSPPPSVPSPPPEEDGEEPQPRASAPLPSSRSPPPSDSGSASGSSRARPRKFTSSRVAGPVPMAGFGAPEKVYALSAQAEAGNPPAPRVEGGMNEVALNSTLILQGFVRQVEGTRFAIGEARREAFESFAAVGATSRIATRVVSENDRSQPRYTDLPSLAVNAPRGPFRARANKQISKAWLQSRVRLCCGA